MPVARQGVLGAELESDFRTFDGALQFYPILSAPTFSFISIQCTDSLRNPNSLSPFDLNVAEGVGTDPGALGCSCVAHSLPCISHATITFVC